MFLISESSLQPKFQGFFFTFILFVCVCIFQCQGRGEKALNPPEAGVTGSSQLLGVGTGILICVL